MADSRVLAADTVGLVQRSLRQLRWRGTFRVIRKLSAGGSGSQVFLLDLDGEHAVLKVTEDPDWQERAEHEFAIYDQFAELLKGVLPEVRARHRDRHAVRLLVTAYQPCPSASALDEVAWVWLADQLGHMQCVPVPTAAWLRSRPWPSSEEVAAAVRLWDGRGAGVPAARAAERLAADRNMQPIAGPVLTHGDCHVGNLLQGPAGRVLWIDWQEVCLSSGLDDLVFLWQRAEFDGAHPPREAMTAAYAAARRLPLDDDFRSAVTACELRLLLLAWPHFLAYGHQDRQQIMTQRLQQLAAGNGA